MLAVHCTVKFGGHVITGGVASCTRINWIHVLELPQSSVAIHVLVIVKVCGPVGFDTSVCVMVGVVSQLSVAVAVPVTTGLVDAEHSIETLFGHVIAGGRLSSTTIV